MAKHKRTYNIGIIKKTYSYKIEEIANLFGIHKGTVRQWCKDGLKKVDKFRPFLIRGSDIVEFLREKQSRKKRKCLPDELYCFRCRLPRRPKDMKVIIEMRTKKVGLMKGLCSACNSKINKSISAKKLEEIGQIFEIIKIHDKNLSGFDSPILNIDLEKES